VKYILLFHLKVASVTGEGYRGVEVGSAQAEKETWIAERFLDFGTVCLFTYCMKTRVRLYRMCGYNLRL